MRPSGLWLRSLAAIIDLVLVIGVSSLIVWKFGVDNSEGDRTLHGLPAIGLILGCGAYWFCLEGLTGATFGKWSCDLRVVSEKGAKISLAQSLKRNVLRAVDFFPWYLPGFICAKLTPNRQRLGDLWAKTIVVNCAEIKRHSAPMPVRA